MGGDHCVRFVFRVSPSLSYDEPQFEFSFLGRSAQIRSHNEKIPLKDSQRVVMNVPGFGDAESAWEFARRIHATAPIAGVNADIGLDVGDNRSTMDISHELRKAMELAGGGISVRTEVRGVDVYVPGTVSFIGVEAHGSSSVAPSKLIAAMEEAFEAGGIVLSEKVRLGIRMRTEALLLTDTTARFVVVVAAVEALTDEGKWSSAQRTAIEKFVIEANALDIPSAERIELVRQLGSLRRLGVMEKMRRLFRRLGLEEIWPRWKAVYDVRSLVLHGSLHPKEITQHLTEAMALSRQILLGVVNEETTRALSPCREAPMLPDG